VIIANPIYDAVFKYLMDDLEIAKGLISTIIGEEVTDLAVQPQETSAENLAYGLTVFRLDFKATVRTAAGEIKKVLIELQKAKHLLDGMRFRRYLGENYRQEDQARFGDGAYATVLPILTIYFLGFKPENVEVPVPQVDRVYRNGVTGEVLNVREPFVEQLTHDSYAIQIPRLGGLTQTKLEKVLQVFSQEFTTSDQHQLDFQGDSSDPLVKKLLDKLTRAVPTPALRKQMEVEDEIDHVFERELEKKNQEIAEKDQEIAEKERLIAEERQQKEAALRELEELRKRLLGG
jgi:hypothetical protein